MELAGSSPRRTSLLIALGAAAAVAALALVLAGPSLVACWQGPGGPATCFGGGTAEAGLLPGEAPPPAEPLDTGTAGGPVITLLRAEPDGSLVIAGSGRPGARIEVYAGEQVLGTAVAERSGDWVVVPESKAPTGGVEITAADAQSGDRGRQSFVVVIDPERTADPVVVATGPGEDSRMLQGMPPLLRAVPGADGARQ